MSPFLAARKGIHRNVVSRRVLSDIPDSVVSCRIQNVDVALPIPGDPGMKEGVIFPVLADHEPHILEPLAEEGGVEPCGSSPAMPSLPADGFILNPMVPDEGIDPKPVPFIRESRGSLKGLFDPPFLTLKFRSWSGGLGFQAGRERAG